MKRNVDKKMTHVHNATILGLKIIEIQLTGIKKRKSAIY